MNLEIAGLGAGAALGGGGAAAAAGAAPTQVGYGASLADVGNFERTLARLDPASAAQGPSDAVRQLMQPFEAIDGEASKLSADADAARASGRDMTPGEVVQLTVRAQEFMFHCQLVSNVANRTSDGLQQLFRQQS